MQRILLVVAALAVAATPAVAGLTANPALSQQMPVRLPSQTPPTQATHAPATEDRPSSSEREDTAEHWNSGPATRRPATSRPAEDHGQHTEASHNGGERG